jgi:hypothetical protein
MDIESCEGCPHLLHLSPPICLATQDERAIHDTAEIPDWCPLSDPPEAALCKLSAAESCRECAKTARDALPMMTDGARAVAKALVEAMMAGIDLTHDLEGHVHLKFTICPYCETQLEDFGAAKAHDAACEKHPAVIRLAARELDIERAAARCRMAKLTPRRWRTHIDAAIEILMKPEAANG